MCWNSKGFRYPTTSINWMHSWNPVSSLLTPPHTHVHEQGFKVSIKPAVLLSPENSCHGFCHPFVLIRPNHLCFCKDKPFQPNDISPKERSKQSGHIIMQKNTRATSQCLQVWASMLSVKVYDCTVLKRRSKYGLIGFGLPREKSLLSYKNMSALISFVKLHLEKKWKWLIILCYIWRKQHVSIYTSYQLSSTVGHYFGVFCSHRTWAPAVIGSTMNPSVYQNILESTVRPCVWQLKLVETGSCSSK